MERQSELGRELAAAEDRRAELAKQQEQVEQRLASLRREVHGEQEKSLKQQQDELRALGATSEQIPELSRLHKQIAEAKEQEKQKDAAEKQQRERERAAEVARRKADQERSRMQSEADSIRRAFASPAELLSERFVELRRLARRGMITTREFIMEGHRAARELADRQPLGSVTTADATSAEGHRALFEQQQADREAAIQKARTDALIKEADRLADKETKRLEHNRQITRQMEA